MPDATDTEITEIQSNAMHTVDGAALQGDVIHDDMVTADAFDTDAFNGGTDHDEDTSDVNQSDGESLEISSQGK